MAYVNFKNLKGDIFGGITAGIVALPLALAFGIQAFSGIEDPIAPSLGALAGLTGAMMLGFFASLFGGTPSQISGPTGPMTVITASLLAGAWSRYGDFSSVLLSMSLAGLFCGLFQILFGVLRIGKYIRYIPYPVLSGFMSGIGVIIILQQIYPLLGLKAPVKTIDMVAGLPSAVPGLSWVALALGVCTIAIIYLFPLLTKKVPATLVALLAVTVGSLFLREGSIPLIGEIPSGFPLPFFVKDSISLDNVVWKDMIMDSLIPGITLAGLGSIDTLLTSVVADNITHTRHNSNKELIGQGIGNMMSGLFSGIGGAGATMRTVVNVKSGGRTPVSGMIHALLLLAILLGLGSIVKYVPLCVLAGILITVGWGIIDFKGFKDIARIPRSDAFVMLSVFLLTVFVDLLTAVAIGVVLSCVLLMKRTSDMVEGSYSVIEPSSPLIWDDDTILPDEYKSVLSIIKMDGPLFFGSVTRFNELVASVSDESRMVLLRMRYVSYLDQSGLYALESALKDFAARGLEIYMTGVNELPESKMKAIHIIPGLISEDHLFKNFKGFSEYVVRAKDVSRS